MASFICENIVLSNLDYLTEDQDITDTFTYLIQLKNSIVTGDINVHSNMVLNIL